jgi:hypothetical protein
MQRRGARRSRNGWCFADADGVWFPTVQRLRRARSIALLAALGAKYVRVSVQVPQDFLDAAVGAATAHGLRVILLSAYAAQPVDLAGYALAAAQVQARYAAANPIWEIWNEPNLPQYWNGPPDVGAYIAVLAATATALRAAGATDIWTGGTSGVDLSWIYNLVTRGAFRSANGCAVHSYKPPGFARTEYHSSCFVSAAGRRAAYDGDVHLEFRRRSIGLFHPDVVSAPRTRTADLHLVRIP